MFGVSQKSLQNLVLNDFYPRIIQDQAWDVKLVHNSAQVKDTSHKEQETKRCEAAFDGVIASVARQNSNLKAVTACPVEVRRTKRGHPALPPFEA